MFHIQNARIVFTRFIIHSRTIKIHSYVGESHIYSYEWRCPKQTNVLIFEARNMGFPANARFSRSSLRAFSRKISRPYVRDRTLDDRENDRQSWCSRRRDRKRTRAYPGARSTNGSLGEVEVSPYVHVRERSYVSASAIMHGAHLSRVHLFSAAVARFITLAFFRARCRPLPRRWLQPV